MAEKMKDLTNPKTDSLKFQTADALEEAARRLRTVDLSEKTDDVMNILQEAEERMNRFRNETGVEFEKIADEYHKKVEPVENIITAHPIPAVLIALTVPGTGGDGSASTQCALARTFAGRRADATIAPIFSGVCGACRDLSPVT